MEIFKFTHITFETKWNVKVKIQSGVDYVRLGTLSLI